MEQFWANTLGAPSGKTHMVNHRDIPLNKGLALTASISPALLPSLEWTNLWIWASIFVLFGVPSSTRASPAARSPSPLGTPQPPHGAFSNIPQGPKSSGIPLRSTGAAAELGRSWAAWCRIVFTWMFLLIEFLFLRSWGMPVGYLHTGKQCTQGEAK